MDTLLMTGPSAGMLSLNLSKYHMPFLVLMRNLKVVTEIAIPQTT